jgi:transposase
MRIYVGMDVHRKRSQVAVVDEAGNQQRNRNVPNDPTKLVPILGALPPGTRSPSSRLRPGLAGGAARRAGAGTAPGPSQPLQGDRLGQAQERQGRRGHPGPAAPGRICCPRPGSPRRPPAICGRCCATGPPWSACRPHARTGSMPCWPTAASVRTGACGLVLGGPGWLTSSCRRSHAGSSRTVAGCWMPWPPHRPAGAGDRCVGQARPRVQALMILPGIGKLTAMTLVAEIGDIGRFPPPASCAPGPA